MQKQGKGQNKLLCTINCYKYCFKKVVVAVLQSQIYFNFNTPLIRGDVVSGRQNVGFRGVFFDI